MQPSTGVAMCKSIGMIVLWMSCLAVVGAQTRTFEVASIKRNNSGSIVGDGARTVGVQPGGRFVMVDGTALVLIRSAFSDAVEVDWTARLLRIHVPDERRRFCLHRPSRTIGPEAGT